MRAIGTRQERRIDGKLKCPLAASPERPPDSRTAFHTFAPDPSRFLPRG